MYSHFDLRLSEAKRLFPGRPCTETLNRYCTKGIKRPTGQRVFLKSVLVGGCRYTSAEAVREFLAAQNPPRHDEAEEELFADGC